MFSIRRFFLLGARDRNDVRALRQHPGRASCAGVQLFFLAMASTFCQRGLCARLSPAVARLALAGRPRRASPDRRCRSEQVRGRAAHRRRTRCRDRASSCACSFALLADRAAEFVCHRRDRMHLVARAMSWARLARPQRADLALLPSSPSAPTVSSIGTLGSMRCA